MSVNDILRKAATKKGSKPSTDMIEIPVPPGLLSSHKLKYDASKSAKAELELSEEELLSHVKPEYQKTLKERFVNSARLAEGEVEATVSWKDAYTKVPSEKETEIRDLVGNKYDDYFKTVNEIVVKEDVASNERLLEELIAAVGPETFGKFFDVAQHVKPTSRFTQERYRELSPEVNNQLDVTVRQYKPAVRMKAL